MHKTGIKMHTHTDTQSGIENVQGKLTTIGIKGLIINIVETVISPRGDLSTLSLQLSSSLCWYKIYCDLNLSGPVLLIAEQSCSQILPALDNLWTM